jgi:GxxExxY protein
MLSQKEEEIAAKIVDSAYIVHKSLGPGLLESIYEACFCHELAKRSLKFEKQCGLPLKYDGIIFEEGLRLDVLVENQIICEIKAAIDHNPLFEAQLLTYLKLSNKKLGFLINFNVRWIKDGIKRFIN